jgi:hypothetical protein
VHSRYISYYTIEVDPNKNKKCKQRTHMRRMDCGLALNELSITFGKDRVGLYRDDGLILLKGTRGRLADQS